MFTILLVGRIVARRVSADADQRYRGRIMRVWAHMVLWISGFRLTVTGHPLHEKCFSVSNHLSVLDSVIICAVTGGALVARHDLAHWPIIGLITRKADTIFINRERRKDIINVNRVLSERLAQGHAIHIFPEGRIGDGVSVRPFNTSIMQPVTQADMPTYFMTINYATYPGDPSPLHSIYWGSHSFSEHVMHILALKGGQIDLTFHDTPIHDDDRKRLAQKLHDAIAAEFKGLE